MSAAHTTAWKTQTYSLSWLYLSPNPTILNSLGQHASLPNTLSFYSRESLQTPICNQGNSLYSLRYKLNKATMCRKRNNDSMS